MSGYINEEDQVNRKRTKFRSARDEGRQQRSCVEKWSKQEMSYIRDATDRE